MTGTEVHFFKFRVHVSMFFPLPQKIVKATLFFVTLLLLFLLEKQVL